MTSYKPGDVVPISIPFGLVEAERFLAAVSRDKFDYAEWRRTGLPAMTY